MGRRPDGAAQFMVARKRRIFKKMSRSRPAVRVDVPRVRSIKTMGTSTIRAPLTLAVF